MTTIAILLLSSLVTVIAVIGLADAMAHLVRHVARSLRKPETLRAVSPPTQVSRRDRRLTA